MDKSKEVRLRQQFDKAFTLLHTALKEKQISEYSDLEREGIIQRFKYTYELSWKTIKVYLEYGGIVFKPSTPRNILKEAYNGGLIDDGQCGLI